MKSNHQPEKDHFVIWKKCNYSPDIRPKGIVFQETHESSWSSWKPSMASKVLETQYLRG